MICIHYEVYSHKNLSLIVSNFGWYSSIESAENALEDSWGKNIVIITKVNGQPIEN